jgi:hypothetical protein
MGVAARTKLAMDFDRYSARRFLEQHGVLRSLSACFVDHNARCPECGAAVYYYENAAGSRVYFDELGPPWPKHPCTDRKPDSRPRSSAEIKPPRPRARGLMLELIEKASVVAEWPSFALRGDADEAWSLIHVLDSERAGFLSTVKAEFLGADPRRWIRFTFNSPDPKLKTGDVCAMRDEQISVLDEATMKPRLYKISILGIEVADPEV